MTRSVKALLARSTVRLFSNDRNFGRNHHVFFSWQVPWIGLPAKQSLSKRSNSAIYLKPNSVRSWSVATIVVSFSNVQCSSLWLVGDRSTQKLECEWYILAPFDISTHSMVNFSTPILSSIRDSSRPESIYILSLSLSLLSFRSRVGLNWTDFFPHLGSARTVLYITFPSDSENFLKVLLLFIYRKSWKD